MPNVVDLSSLAKCAICGTETELHVGGVPICVKCQESSVLPSKEKTTPRVPQPDSTDPPSRRD